MKQTWIYALAALPLVSATPGRAQESKAAFDTPVVLLGPYEAPYKRVLDLDGDGRMDAIGTRLFEPANPDQFLVRLYGNDGSGTLTYCGWADVFDDLAEGDDPIAVGKLDLDAREDFAIANTSVIRMWLSNGLATPTALPALTLPVFADILDLVVADLNGDGLNDIAALTVDTVFVFRATAPASFARVPSSVSIGSDGHHLMVAGLDGLFGQDLVVERMVGTDTWLLLVPVIHGNPTVGASYDTAVDEGMSATGDVDNDGDDDVVVFGMAGSYRVLRQTSTGNFTLEAPQTGGPATELADVDGDGDLDGVCCGGGGSNDPPNNALSNFEISINQGAGAFAPAFRIEGLGAEHIAGASDLDGDGDVDLIAGRVVYYAPGPLKAPPAPPVPSAIPTNLMSHLADFDRDGDPDLRTGLTTLLQNDGTGTLSPAITTMLGVPPGTQWLNPGWPGDWDGDGDMDILGSEHVAVGDDRNVLLRNAGGGTLVWGGNVQPSGMLNAFYSQVAADVDFDGDVDLVLTTDNPTWQVYFGTTEVYLNDGTPGFALAWSFPQTTKAFVDIDQDGMSDYLTLQAGDIGWRRDIGGGQPGDLALISNAATQGWVSQYDVFALADLDADGDLDVAYQGNQNNDMLPTWLALNDGTGQFSAATGSLPIYDIGSINSSQRRIDAVEVNGDGHLDLVVKDINAPYIICRVHLWTGPGLVYGTGAQQILTQGWMSDLDGDGDVDYLSKKYAFMNRRYVGPQAGMRKQSGTGVAGSAGLVPVLGAEGPFRAGETVDVHATNGRGGTQALFAFSLSGATLPNLPFPGMTLYFNVFHPSTVIVPFGASGTPGAPGEGAFGFSIGIPAPIAGYDIYHQAFFVDPASSNGIVSASGLLYIHYGS